MDRASSTVAASVQKPSRSTYSFFFVSSMKLPSCLRFDPFSVQFLGALA